MKILMQNTLFFYGLAKIIEKFSLNMCFFYALQILGFSYYFPNHFKVMVASCFLLKKNYLLTVFINDLENYQKTLRTI